MALGDELWQQVEALHPQTVIYLAMVCIVDSPSQSHAGASDYLLIKVEDGPLDELMH